MSNSSCALLPPSALQRACDGCQARKLKCSNRLCLSPVPGPCLRCSAARIDCTYTKRKPSRLPRSGRFVSPKELIRHIFQPITSYSIVDALRAKQTAKGSPKRGPVVPAQWTVEENDLPFHNVGKDCEPTLSPPVLGMSGISQTKSIFSSLPTTNGLATAGAISSGLYISNNNPLQKPYLRGETLNFTSHLGYVPTILEIEVAFNVFMQTLYMKCPVVHYETFLSKIHNGVHNTDKDFALLVNAIVMLQHDIQYRLIPVCGEAELRSHLRQLEIQRLDFDFALAPTLDTIIVSLALFQAHHTIGQNDRALLYLTEAIELFQRVRIEPNAIEHLRNQRIRHLLFVIESSCIASSEVSRKQYAEVPTNVDDLVPWYYSDTRTGHLGVGFGDTEIPLSRLDDLATRVLSLMSTIYKSKNTRILQSLDIHLQIFGSNGPESSKEVERTAMHVADLGLTRQWLISADLNNSLLVETVTTGSSIEGSVELVVNHAIEWAQSLTPGDLRIVGLGKLFDVVKNASATGLWSPSNLTLDNLIRVVTSADYESHYVSPLSDIVILMGGLPSAIGNPLELHAT